MTITDKIEKLTRALEIQEGVQECNRVLHGDYVGADVKAEYKKLITELAQAENAGLIVECWCQRAEVGNLIEQA